MKQLITFLFLLIGLVALGQDKAIYQLEKPVKIYWFESEDAVLITDINDVPLHPKMYIVDLDSTEYKGEKVVLIYGKDVIISYANSYVAYDTVNSGYVYNIPVLFRNKK